MITEKQLKEWDAIWKRIVEGAVPALIDEVIRLGRMATYYETAVLDAKQRRESKYGGYTMDEIVAEGKPFAVSSTHSELITDLALDDGIY